MSQAWARGTATDKHLRRPHDANQVGLGTHQILVIPPTDRIPVDTLKKIVDWSQQGGKVLAIDHTPTLDPEGNAFCVIAEKVLYGKRHMGVVRSTFLIDPDGKLVHQWRNIKVSGHVDAVLERIPPR